MPLTLKNITTQTLGAGNGFNVEINDLGITIFEAEDYIVDDEEFWEIKASGDVLTGLTNNYIQILDSTGAPYSTSESQTLFSNSQLSLSTPGSVEETDFLITVGAGGEFSNTVAYVDPVTNHIGINTQTPAADLTLKGNLRIEGPTAGSTEIRVISGDEIIYNLPTTPGTTGQILSNTGNGNLQWVDNISEQTDLVGSLFSYNFVYETTGSNRWLCFNGDTSLNSNISPALFPWKSELVAITFTNSNELIDSDIEFYSVKEGDTPLIKTLDVVWQLRNVRTARKANFTTPVVYDSGDKLSLYIRNQGSSASKIAVTCFFKVLEDFNEESFESFSGDLSV